MAPAHPVSAGEVQRPSHCSLSQRCSSKSQVSPDVLGSLGWWEQALLRSGMLLEEKAFLIAERFR